MSNKAHLRPHRKKRQASPATGLLLVILLIALVVLATAMVATGHAMPTGRIIPLRGGRSQPLPPLEYAHRLQRHPLRRLARSVVHLEPDPAGQAPVEGPAAVRRAAGPNMIDRVAQPWVGR